MILIDRLQGSNDLLSEVLALGVKASLESLPAGDAQFEGNGPDGRCLIGVERKKLYPDLLNCMQGGRLTGSQIPRMIKAGCEWNWLIVEGLYRPNSVNGQLEQWVINLRSWKPVRLGTRGFMYREVDNFLNTIEMKTRVRIKRSGSRSETARIIVDLYHWWNDKEWEEHRSHQPFWNGDQVQIWDPPFTRRLAKELKGIGWEKSKAVSEYFGGDAAVLLDFMLKAGVKEWAQIPGIGDAIAKKIVLEIHGGA
jgi:ERCC4-type nuclease